MAKNGKGQIDEMALPEGYVPLKPARSAGFFVKKPGNMIEGKMVERIEMDDPNNPGKRRALYKIEVTVGDKTVITDAETRKERTADEGEMVGLDETGYLQSFRDVQKGQQVVAKCVRQQRPDETKKGRSAAWIFATGVVPF